MKIEKYIKEHKSEFDELSTSKEFDAFFEQRLQKELHEPKKGKLINMRFISVAASVVLVLGTVYFLYQNNQTNKHKQELMADLSNSSTGTRLEAVYTIDDAFEKEDNEIIDVLIETLLTDTNANVKIATIEALAKFPNNEKMRMSLVEALKKEKQPLVQIKLINTLSALRETRAKEPLEDIINNQNSFDIVKSNANLAMANLNQ